MKKNLSEILSDAQKLTDQAKKARGEEGVAPLTASSDAPTPAYAPAPAPKPVVRETTPEEALSAFETPVDRLVDRQSIYQNVADIAAEGEELCERMRALIAEKDELRNRLGAQILQPDLTLQLQLEQDYNALQEKWTQLQKDVQAFDTKVNEVVTAGNSTIAKQIESGSELYERCATALRELQQKKGKIVRKESKQHADAEITKWNSNKKAIKGNLAKLEEMDEQYARLHDRELQESLQEAMSKPDTLQTTADLADDSLYKMLEQSRQKLRGMWITAAEYADMDKAGKDVQERIDRNARMAQNVQDDVNGSVKDFNKVPAATTSTPPLIDDGDDSLDIDGSDNEDFEDFEISSATGVAPYATTTSKHVAPDVLLKKARQVHERIQKTGKQITNLEQKLQSLNTEIDNIKQELKMLEAQGQKETEKPFEKARRKGLEARHKAAQNEVEHLSNELKVLSTRSRKDAQQNGKINGKMAQRKEALQEQQKKLSGGAPIVDATVTNTSSTIISTAKSYRQKLEETKTQIDQDRKTLQKQQERLKQHFALIKLTPDELREHGNIARQTGREYIDIDRLEQYSKAISVKMGDLDGVEVRWKAAMKDLEAAEKPIVAEVAEYEKIGQTFDNSLSNRDTSFSTRLNAIGSNIKRLERELTTAEQLSPLAEETTIEGLAPEVSMAKRITDLAPTQSISAWARSQGRLEMSRYIIKSDGRSLDSFDPSTSWEKSSEDFKWIRDIGFPINIIGGLLTVTFTVVGFIARIANAALTFIGAVVEFGSRMASKGLKMLGNLCSKPLELASKEIEKADIEGKTGARIGWRAVAVLCIVPKAIGSICNILSSIIKSLGNLIFEGCSLVGKAAVFASRPWDKDTAKSMVFSAGKTISAAVSAATNAAKQMGTEIREVGNNTNIPGVKHIFGLAGGLLQSAGISLEGAVEAARQSASGHTILSKEIILTAFRTSWSNIKSAVMTQGYEISQTAGKVSGVTHEHLMKVSQQDVGQGEERVSIAKPEPPLPASARNPVKSQGSDSPGDMAKMQEMLASMMGKMGDAGPGETDSSTTTYQDRLEEEAKQPKGKGVAKTN
ncbi:MAG: hypothetical protein JSS50_00520 [Proteobacteria bacterium]|nr:hypothetical protein [Pseudomonadota bacterium]